MKSGMTPQLMGLWLGLRWAFRIKGGRRGAARGYHPPLIRAMFHMLQGVHGGVHKASL